MRDNADKKLLLIGNPNVGKSALFSRLTGARVTISNYPGTTIGISKGYMLFDNTPAIIIDVPGIYNVTPVCKADEVATEMIAEGELIINVVDSTNLERNLFLTLEIREKGKPMVVALNMWDETKHKGIDIDTAKLEKELGVPVVPVCGITGFGVKELVEKLPKARAWQNSPLTRDQKWEEVGRIVDLCQTLHHHRHTFLEKLEDASTRPSTGIPIAIVVMALSFAVLRGIAETLISHVFDPFFDKIWMPLMIRLSSHMGDSGLVHNILIGRLQDGQISFGESFGLLTTGLYIPIAAVLPYMFSFYLVLGILEDIGYLPRLATQVDNLMHKIGLHGYAVVPMILGLGCSVPGVMATRLLENRREKFIAATLLAISVPCMAQTAMIVGLVGERGGRYVLLVFLTLFLIFVIKGLILNALLPGKSPEILWEIPPYRMPKLQYVLKKIWYRVSEYLMEALPVVLGGVLVLNILYTLNVFDYIAKVCAPVVTGLWGLPRETVSSIIVGFLRKDMAVGMLGPLHLTTKQLVIACTVLAVYFPCVATFLALVRELGVKDMLKSAFLMLLTALVVGTLLNIIL